MLTNGSVSLWLGIFPLECKKVHSANLSLRLAENAIYTVVQFEDFPL